MREKQSPTGELRKPIYDAEGENYDPKELFESYMKFGGMPSIADIGLDIDKVLTLLDGIYSTVVMRDILERAKRRGRRQITDAELLRKIIMFLADNIGNNTSITSIGNTLVNEKLIDTDKRNGRPAVQTIQAYVGALLESYRIDILKVNETLKFLLEIKDKAEQSVEIQDAHRFEIKEYRAREKLDIIRVNDVK